MGKKITKISCQIVLISNPVQGMTEAEHNRPILKFFGNWPSASGTEIFSGTMGLVIHLKISLELCLSPYS